MLECASEVAVAVSDLKQRTKVFALDVVRLIGTLPHNNITTVIERQLLRSATSVGANYRSACFAKSKADFISKMCIVQEEADESVYWLELLEESGIARSGEIRRLKKEGSELLSIAISSIKTAKKHLAGT
jgi:four helix bundle protein